MKKILTLTTFILMLSLPTACNSNRQAQEEIDGDETQSSVEKDSDLKVDPLQNYTGRETGSSGGNR